MRDLGTILIGIAVILLGLWTGKLRDREHRLEQKVACLEHPHGASSIAGKMINGKFVVTQPVTRTGCVK